MNTRRRFLCAMLFNMTAAAGVMGSEAFISGKASGEWPGAVTVWNPLPPLPSNAALPNRLVLKWQVESGVPNDLRITLCFKDKDGRWFQREIAPEETNGGEPRAIVLSLAAHDPDIGAVGHGGVWNEYARARITDVGVRFTSSQAGAGNVHFQINVDAVPHAASHPPQASRFRGGSGFALREADYQSPTSWRAVVWQPFEIAFDLSPDAARPHDADALAVALEIRTPDGTTVTRPAFYDQPHTRWLDATGTERTTPQGRAVWKARFTPAQPGTHRWRIVVKTAAESSALTGWRTLRVAPESPSASRGFVRPSENDPSHFVDAGGKPFWPLGIHLHSPVDQRYARLARRASNEKTAHAGTFFYEQRFARMAEAGMNAAIVWMSNWNLSIEWNADWPGFGGLRDYHQANAWRIDQVFAAAARHGIHILLVLDNHGKLSNGIDAEWPSSPYNIANGGPCATPEDFWTNDEAFRHYVNRLRYIVARWGSYPNLLGYTLVSEINWTGSRPAMNNLPQHAAWLARVRAALQHLDVHDRPVTIQYSGRPQDWDENVFASEALSFLTVNAYRSAASTSETLPDTLRGIYAHAAIFNKPTLIAEYGGDWNGTTPARLHADLRAGLWTALASGASAAPFFWWHEFVEEHDLYGEFAPVARIVNVVNTSTHPLKRIEAFITENGQPSRRIKAVASASAHTARLWLADAAALEIIPASPPPPHDKAEVTLPGLPPGEYAVAWFGTDTGAAIKEEHVQTDKAGLSLSVPPFATGVFAFVQRTGQIEGGNP